MWPALACSVACCHDNQKINDRAPSDRVSILLLAGKRYVCAVSWINECARAWRHSLLLISDRRNAGFSLWPDGQCRVEPIADEFALFFTCLLYGLKYHLHWKTINICWPPLQIQFLTSSVQVNLAIAIRNSRYTYSNVRSNIHFTRQRVNRIVWISFGNQNQSLLDTILKFE